MSLQESINRAIELSTDLRNIRTRETELTQSLRREIANLKKQGLKYSAFRNQSVLNDILNRNKSISDSTLQAIQGLQITAETRYTITSNHEPADPSYPRARRPRARRIRLSTSPPTHEPADLLPGDTTSPPTC